MDIQQLFREHPEFRSKKSNVYIAGLQKPIIRRNGARVRFYCGFTNNMPRREGEHRKGKACGGSPLLDRANQLGIEWEIVAIWDASRAFERYIKKQRHMERFVKAYQEEVPFEEKIPFF